MEKNEIDIMVDVGFTPEREKKFAFSKETVLLSWTRLYTIKDSNIKSILDLRGKKIAGLQGSVNLNGPEGLKDIIQRFEIDCTIIEMDSYLDIFEALDKNEIDAGITNKDFGHLHENDYNIERTPIIFQPAKMFFAFPKTSELTPLLIDRIDQNLIKLKNDKKSIYYKSLEAHLGGLEKIVIFPLFLKIILIILLFLVLLFIVIRKLSFK